MKRILFSLLLLTAATAARKRPRHPTASTIAPATAPSPSPKPAVNLTFSPPASHGGETRCILCHSVSGWSDVRFAHERTGFPLKGLHKKASCKSCHPSGFDKAVADRCSGCHQDPHAEEFGFRCEGCHDENGWRTLFTADAHRRGNFPLSGRHALIPCTECHPNVRDRSFARAAVECIACHQADYARTATISVNHMTAGFSTSCQQCHNPFRWTPASWGAHDSCFSTTRGPHAGIKCLQCHTTLPPSLTIMSCSSGTVSCTSCHEHTCARTDARHANVPGYQCKDQKCYQCHHF